MLECSNDAAHRYVTPLKEFSFAKQKKTFSKETTKWASSGHWFLATVLPAGCHWDAHAPGSVGQFLELQRSSPLGLTAKKCTSLCSTECTTVQPEYQSVIFLEDGNIRHRTWDRLPHSSRHLRVDPICPCLFPRPQGSLDMSNFRQQAFLARHQSWLCVLNSACLAVAKLLNAITIQDKWMDTKEQVKKMRRASWCFLPLTEPPKQKLLARNFNYQKFILNMWKWP